MRGLVKFVCNTYVVLLKSGTNVGVKAVLLHGTLDVITDYYKKHCTDIVTVIAPKDIIENSEYMTSFED